MLASVREVLEVLASAMNDAGIGCLGCLTMIAVDWQTS